MTVVNVVTQRAVRVVISAYKGNEVIISSSRKPARWENQTSIYL